MDRFRTDATATGPIRQRYHSRAASLLLALLLGVLHGCTGGSPGGSAPPTCDDVTVLFSADRVLADPDSDCFAWVDAARGRVVRQTVGSASIWSRRSEAGPGLLTGAVHTLGVGWFGPQGTDIRERMSNPADTTGVARLFLFRPDGSGPDELASPLFDMYSPAIPAETNHDAFRYLRPRNDFFVAVVDSQKLDVGLLAPTPRPLVNESLPLYDPDGVTTTEPTHADPVEGDLVLLMGFAGAGDLAGELAASVGRVLSDGKAAGVIETLAAAQDEEGDIPYEAEVEMIIEGQAVTGMSGGAALNRAGQQVGILVRASDAHDGTQYVRAVRMAYVVARLAAAFDDLSPEDQAVVQQYLEPRN